MKGSIRTESDGAADLGIRNISSADESGVLAIRDAIYPKYRADPDDWPAANQYDAPLSSSHRYVVLNRDPEQIIGYGAAWQQRPGKFRMDLMVHPRWQRRGVGEHLLARLVSDVRTAGGRTIQARAREDYPASITFLVKRGFVETQRMFGMHLVVSEARLAPHLNLEKQLRRQGIAIAKLSQITQDDRDWLDKLLSLHNSVLPDWPDPDPEPFIPVTREDFQRRLESELNDSTAFFVARDATQFLGYSSLVALGTAVHPDYRRHGIATALKTRAIQDAQRRGVKRHVVCTANPAMLEINEKLGYRVSRTEIRLVRKVV